MVTHVLLAARWDTRTSPYVPSMPFDRWQYMTPPFRGLQNAEVRVGDTPVDTCGMAAGQLAANPLCWVQGEGVRYPGQVLRAECGRPLVGRWVSVQNFPGPFAVLASMALYEVEVWGYPLAAEAPGETLAGQPPTRGHPIADTPSPVPGPVPVPVPSVDREGALTRGYPRLAGCGHHHVVRIVVAVQRAAGQSRCSCSPSAARRHCRA